MNLPCLHVSGDGAILDIYVQPRASKNEIVGLQGQELKVRLTSPPVEGAANKLCREFFAKLLKIPKGKVELLAGDKSRHKRLLLQEVSQEQLQQVLFPYLQKP